MPVDIDLTGDDDDVIDLTGDDAPAGQTDAQKAYLDPVSGFGSVKSIATKLGLPEKQVERELRELPVYQRTLPTRDNKFNEFRIVAEPRSFQVDLTFLPYEKHNDGFPGFLTCIDISSRKAFTYPVRSKKTADVIDALKEFVEEVEPVNISSDNEGALKSNEVRAYLAGENIRQHFHRPNDHNAMGIIDRFTRTLKEMLNKYFLSVKSVRWSEVLPTIIKNYNNRHHSTLNMTPQEMWDDLQAQSDFRKEDYQHNHTILSKTATFDVGSKVRVLQPLSVLEKGRPRYSAKVYTIVGLEGLSYRLRDPAGHMLAHKYRPYELVSAEGDVEDEDVIHKERKANTARRRLRAELGREAAANVAPRVARAAAVNAIVRNQALQNQGLV